MAIIVHFEPKGLTGATYAECMRRLAAAGAATPRGRLYHVCYGDPDALRVVDAYASAEDFAAFGQTLLPILAGLGVDPGQPRVEPITDIVRG